MGKLPDIPQANSTWTIYHNIAPYNYTVHNIIC